MFRNGTVTQPAIALSTTAVPVMATDPPGVVSVTITPTNGTIYWGGPGVTTATGHPLAANTSYTQDTRNPSQLYIIAGGAVDVRVATFTGYRG